MTDTKMIDVLKPDIPESDILKLGLDPGFGGIKVAMISPAAAGSLKAGPSEAGPQMTTYTLPSVVGVGSTDTGALSLAEVVRPGGRRATPHIVAFQGLEYLVGSGVAGYARPLEQTDFTRFNDSPELRALLYTSLYHLLQNLPGRGLSVESSNLPTFEPKAPCGQPSTFHLAIAIGLPVEIMSDKTQAADAERDMKKWLLGPHDFSVGGQQAHLDIINLRTKPQPLGTWLDWGLDLYGQWPQRNGVSAKSPALVIDAGFNTFDLYAIEDGEVSKRYTAGDLLGMRRAAEMVIDTIQRRHGVEPSLHEADDLVQAVVGGRKAHIHVEGKPVEITREVRQAINSLATQALRFTETRVGKAEKFKTFITGGGAQGLGPQLLAQYPHAAIVNEPVLANARGLAKLAIRPGFLD